MAVPGVIIPVTVSAMAVRVGMTVMMVVGMMMRHGAKPKADGWIGFGYSASQNEYYYSSFFHLLRNNRQT